MTSAAYLTATDRGNLILSDTPSRSSGEAEDGAEQLGLFLFVDGMDTGGR